jgi:hypothetical protein
MYYWNVQAWTDGVAGPESATQSFFTQPFCERLEGEELALSGPVLISPDPNAIIDTLHTEFHYSMSESGCLPTGFYLDLDTGVQARTLSAMNWRTAPPTTGA